MKKFLIATLFAFGLSFSMQAQSDISIVAEGDAQKEVMQKTPKISDQPQTKDTVLVPPSFKYVLLQKQYTTTITIDTIAAAKMSGEPLPKLYRGYVRLGIGNYGMLAGDAYVTSMRSKSGAWGMRARHFSAGSGPKGVQGDYAGFSQQEFGVFGKRFLKKHTLSSDFGYDRDVVYNYGSQVMTNFYTRDFSRQRYNLFDGGLRLQSHYHDSDMINHDIGFRYYHFSDLSKTTEQNVRVDVAGGRFIKTEKLHVDLGVDYNRTSNEQDTLNNTIVRFQPMFSVNGRKFDAAIGVGLFFDVGVDQRAFFYPQASFSYDIYNHIIEPYIGVTGKLERNSYRSLTDVNPFMNSKQALALRNTQHRYQIYAGLRGTITADLSYDVRVMHEEQKDVAMFVMATEAEDIFQNKFSVVYDNIDVTQFHGQIGWQRLEKTRLLLSADYFLFKTENEVKPWHMPSLRMSAIAEYNLRDKILARAQIYVLNGQYARYYDRNVVKAVTLGGLTDVNLGFEYRYTKFLSLYANFNNLASQRYFRWDAYPTQRFNVIGGLTYTF
jgi:hypothetical protein